MGINRRNFPVLIGCLVVALVFFLRSSPEHTRETYSTEPAATQDSPSEEVKSAPIASTKSQTSLITAVATTATVNEAPVFSPESLPEPAPASFRGPFRDSFLKDSDGHALIFSSQQEAAKACAAREMRLPTIRELARLGQSRGAKGIQELNAEADLDPVGNTLKPWTVQEGFILVRTLEANGKQDRFYYDHAGYVEPDPDQQAQLAYGKIHGGVYNDPSAPVVHIMQYVSSSAFPTDKQRLILYFGLSDGRIFAQSPAMVAHVRCVAGT